MVPITISEEARALLQARMAESGFRRPLAWIDMKTQEVAVRPGAENDADWTVRRRDLWSLRVAEGEEVPDADARLVTVDGLGFVSDFFPMRFDISVKGGHFRVAAGA
ncbi:MAG: hypothetical protein ABIR98_06455 [Usitatibacter sp.]